MTIVVSWVLISHKASSSFVQLVSPISIMMLLELILIYIPSNAPDIGIPLCTYIKKHTYICIHTHTYIYIYINIHTSYSCIDPIPHHFHPPDVHPPIDRQPPSPKSPLLSPSASPSPKSPSASPSSTGQALPGQVERHWDGTRLVGLDPAEMGIIKEIYNTTGDTLGVWRAKIRQEIWRLGG